MVDQELDFYRALRAKIQCWAESEEGRSNKWVDYLLLAPDLFHLLCKLTVDRDVPAAQKAKLAVAIAYFVSPIDLLPEALIGPMGFVDDIALAAYVLNSVVNGTSPDVVGRHWAGDGDVLEVIQHIIEVADEMVGSGLWKKLKRLT